MRDIPFWFAFVALGALAACSRTLAHPRHAPTRCSAPCWLPTRSMPRCAFSASATPPTYDSIAFFGYAALLCVAAVRHPAELAAARLCSARAATSSISGTSSSSWRCAIMPRCASSDRFAGFAITLRPDRRPQHRRACWPFGSSPLPALCRWLGA